MTPRTGPSTRAIGTRTMRQAIRPGLATGFIAGPTDLAANAWHTLTWEVDLVNSKVLNVYLDGVLIGEQDGALNDMNMEGVNAELPEGDNVARPPRELIGPQNQPISPKAEYGRQRWGGPANLPARPPVSLEDRAEPNVYQPGDGEEDIAVSCCGGRAGQHHLGGRLVEQGIPDGAERRQ